jgi:CRP-like cAMP-binding protein/predicted MFS family arabinose efflux permease
MRGTRGMTAALRHRDFRFLLTGYTAALVGSWAYNVGLAVWVFEETGSAGWLAAATICRFVPALLFSTYAGVLADRFERVRLMVSLDLAAAAFMAVLAFETALGAPVAVVIATSALSATVGTIYEPAAAAVTPQVVGERDLAAANALRGTVDNIAIIAGPGLGALVVLVGPPSVAIGLNAVTFLVSAAAVSRMRTRSEPVDVTEGGTAGPIRQMLVGVRTLTASTTATVLVGYSLLATTVYGFDTVQFVVLSRDLLGTGPDGYGYLLAGLGLGGVIAAPLVVRLERLPRLSLVILVGMAAYCLPTLAFLVVRDPVAATLLQVVRGAGTLVVDVLAITALQRALPSGVLARVFGAFNALFLSAIVLGAALAPIIIDGWGLRASLWAASVGVVALAVLGWPWLVRMDREIAQRRATLADTVQLLAACDLLSSASDGDLDQLAGAAEPVDVPAGAVVVAEGDESDSFYVVVSGRLSVSGRGEHEEARALGRLGPGDYFGEIGLIEQSPRTATVTADEPARLLRIGGDDWLGALAAEPPSPALLEAAALRLGRTHPSRSLTRVALADQPGKPAETT